MTTETAIPVHKIDLTPFREGGSAGRRAVAEAFDRAGRDSGFIQLSGHGVDPALVDAVLDEWQAFFDRPLEEKLRCVAPPESNEMVGYTPFASQALAYTAGQGTPPDLLEAYSVGREDTAGPTFDDVRDWFPPNVWPEGSAPVQAASQSLEAELRRVSDDVLRAMALALELPEEWLVTRCENAVITLRCNHFVRMSDTPPLPDQQRLGAHTDYGVMTLLVADPVPGLQVLRGDVWHDVIPARGTIVCNIGDMLSMWTNDRWVSTMHRVVPPPATVAGTARRRSLARFLDGDPSLTIDPISSCLAPGETPRYASVRAGEWLLAKVLGGQYGQPVDLQNGGLTGATNR